MGSSRPFEARSFVLKSMRLFDPDQSLSRHNDITHLTTFAYQTDKRANIVWIFEKYLLYQSRMSIYVSSLRSPIKNFMAPVVDLCSRHVAVRVQSEEL